MALIDDIRNRTWFMGQAQWGGEFVLKVFKQVADTYCPLNTTELLRKVYTQEVEQVGLQRRLKIGDAQQGVYFTCIVDEENATNKRKYSQRGIIRPFQIDPGFEGRGNSTEPLAPGL